MKEKIPAPIRMIICRTVILTVATAAAGFAFSAVFKDHILFRLSAVISAIGIFRTWNLIRQARLHDYAVAEGEILKTDHPCFESRTFLCMRLPDGPEVRLILAGKQRFREGTYWRLYLTRLPDGIEALELPDRLMPAQAVIGRELMSTSETGLSRKQGDF